MKFERMKNGVRRVLAKGYQFRKLSRLTWKLFAQPLELRYHVGEATRYQSEQHTILIQNILGHFGFTPGQFANQTIVDVGAGSQPVTSMFQQTKIIAIEPLADEFLKRIPSCGLRNVHKIYASPAERRIEELKSSADFAISINVLDHTLAFDQIVENIHFYLKPGASAFLSFDSHDHVDICHPAILTADGCKAKFVSVGFEVTRISRGVWPHGPAYGLGEAINFWLVKPCQGA